MCWRRASAYELQILIKLSEAKNTHNLLTASFESDISDLKKLKNENYLKLS
jgi:hypothetical protein